LYTAVSKAAAQNMIQESLATAEIPRDADETAFHGHPMDDLEPS